LRNLSAGLSAVIAGRDDGTGLAASQDTQVKEFDMSVIISLPANLVAPFVYAS